MNPFSKARELARSSDFKRAQVGCVVVKKKEILAEGVNTDKTSKWQEYYNFKSGKLRGYAKHSMHAEIRALSKLINKHNVDDDMRRVHIYVYRELKDGTIAMARPCAACMAMIKDMGIKHIHYSTPDGYAHEVIC